MDGRMVRRLRTALVVLAGGICSSVPVTAKAQLVEHLPTEADNVEELDHTLGLTYGRVAQLETTQLETLEARATLLATTPSDANNSPQTDTFVAAQVASVVLTQGVSESVETAGELPASVEGGVQNAVPVDTVAAQRTARQIQNYGEAPVDRTPQFLRSVSPLLRQGQWQFDMGLVYGLQENHGPTLGGPGPVLDRLEIRQRNWFVPLAVRYGLTDRAQLFINAPVGFSDTEISDSFDDISGGDFGFGDITFGGTFLLCQDSCRSKSTVLTLRGAAPTNTNVNPLVINSSGLGNGVWNVGADLLVIRSWDPLVLFYGAGYTYNFGERFANRNVDLGHQVFYNLGVGFAANERITLSTAFLGSYVTETKVDGVYLPGSDIEPSRIRLAATIAHNCRLVEPFVNFGVTDSAPGMEAGVIWTY